jgi:hypothetical protein
MDMFQVYQIIQIIIRVLIYTFIGQGALAVMIGARRSENFVYRFFSQITYPVWKLTRLITPRFIPDQQVGFFAVFLLLVLNVALYMFFYAQGWIPSVTTGEAAA